MKKIAILVTLVVTLTLQGFSQQAPQYSLYMFNPMRVNPAYAGSREALSAVLVHRSQWVGLKGAPTTQAFSINRPFRNKKMGLGLQVANDKIGPKNIINASLVYAYRIKVGAGKLAFGLSGGILSYNYDWDKIEYKTPSDQLPNNATESYLLPSFDFGIYYNTQTFYAGIAMDYLNRPEFKFLEVDSLFSQGHVFSHTIVTLGKAFVLNDNLVLKTSILFRAAETDDASLNINGSLLIKQKILFGFAITNRSTLTAIFELKLSKNLKLGYAYDYTAGELLGNFGGAGSHEVFLGYDMEIFKSKVSSPRYF